MLLMEFGHRTVEHGNIFFLLVVDVTVFLNRHSFVVATVFITR